MYCVNFFAGFKLLSYRSLWSLTSCLYDPQGYRSLTSYISDLRATDLSVLWVLVYLISELQTFLTSDLLFIWSSELQISDLLYIWSSGLQISLTSYISDLQSYRSLWPGVPGWRVPSVPAVDEGQHHHWHPGPHLHRQRRGLWTGWCVFVCVLDSASDPLAGRKHAENGIIVEAVRS